MFLTEHEIGFFMKNSKIVNPSDFSIRLFNSCLKYKYSFNYLADILLIIKIIKIISSIFEYINLLFN